MKKVFERILTVVFILILGYQQFCYADSIVIEPIDEFRPIAILVGFIGISVLIVTAISFFTLKSTVKEQRNKKNNSKKINDEKIEKRQNRIQRTFYAWGIILSIVVMRYETLSDEISWIAFLFPIILFIISFIVRLDKEEKKRSNIICGVAIILVVIIALYGNISNKILSKISEEYNQQFLQYIYGGMITNNYRTDNVEGLINTAVESNKGDREITIEYQNVEYTSQEELKQLLSKINVGAEYGVKISYNNYYIKSISLYLNVDKEKMTSLLITTTTIKKYEGVPQKGNDVKSLIREVCEIMSDKELMRYPVAEVNIVYIPKPNQKTTISLNTVSLQEYIDFENEIKDEETYEIECQTDLNDECDIIITKNNN